MAAVADDAFRAGLAVSQGLGAEADFATVGFFAEEGQAQCRFAAGDGTGDADDVAGLGGKGQALIDRLIIRRIGKGQVTDRKGCRRKGRYRFRQGMGGSETGLDAVPRYLGLLDGIEQAGGDGTS